MYNYALPILAFSTMLIGAGCSTTAPAPSYPTVGSVSRADDRLNELVPADARIEQIASGFAWSEGPVWVEEGSYLLFSDIPNNAIYKWEEGEGLSLFMRPAGYAGAEPSGAELGTNGLLIGPDGSLVAADHGNRAIVRINDEIFTKEILVGAYQGKRLNSPNDAVFSSTGDLYFTDPPYGLDGLNDSPDKELPYNGVYLLTREGDVTLLTADLAFPNGIAFSPDEQTLYVGQSDGRNPIIMAFDVKADGTIENGRVFFDGRTLDWGGFDGMKVDVHGNLFATGPGGVLVIAPDGTYLGTIETGLPTANVAFGGEDFSTLFITAESLLLRIPTTTQGLRLLEPTAMD